MCDAPLNLSTTQQQRRANELIQPAKQHKNNSVIKAQNPYRQVHTHWQTPTETHILDLGPQLHIAAFLRLAVRIDQVLEQFRGQYVSKAVLLCLLYFLTKKRAKLDNLQRAGREYLVFISLSRARLRRKEQHSGHVRIQTAQ